MVMESIMKGSLAFVLNDDAEPMWTPSLSREAIKRPATQEREQGKKKKMKMHRSLRNEVCPLPASVPPATIREFGRVKEITLHEEMCKKSNWDGAWFTQVPSNYLLIKEDSDVYLLPSTAGAQRSLFCRFRTHLPGISEIREQALTAFCAAERVANRVARDSALAGVRRPRSYSFGTTKKYREGKCGLVAWALRNPEKVEALLPVYEACWKSFSSLMPEEALVLSNQSENAYYTIPNTAWTSSTFNINQSTSFHRDERDVEGGASCLVTFRSGNTAGGTLCFPELKLALFTSDCSFISYYPKKWLHGSTRLGRVEQGVVLKVNSFSSMGHYKGISTSSSNASISMDASKFSSINASIGSDNSNI